MCVLLCKVLKVLTLLKYHGDIAKTGDKSSLHCRFQSNTYTKVVKASTWKLLYMILMKIKCACHLFCEVWQRGSPVMPLFWNWYIHIEKVCVSNFFKSFQVIFLKIMVFLISFDKVGKMGIHITISDSSIFNR